MEKMRRTESFNLLHADEIEEMLVNHMFHSIKRHQKGVFWCIEATNNNGECK
jgi:hypothetical protein